MKGRRTEGVSSTRNQRSMRLHNKSLQMKLGEGNTWLFCFVAVDDLAVIGYWLLVIGRVLITNYRRLLGCPLPFTRQHQHSDAR
jgi:hypothetical protein